MAKKRARQQALPEIGDQQFAEVDDAMKDYIDASDGWTDARTAIQKAKDKLITRMKDQGLESYKFDGRIAKLEHKNVDDVKVKKIGEEAEADGDED